MRFLNAVNVVIRIIFFCSFHNDISVVLISKTVSIDVNYLLKLGTFHIHFDEGKWTFIRSSEGDQRFPGKKKKKTQGEKLGIYQKYIFLCFLGKVLFRGHQFCSLS